MTRLFQLLCALAMLAVLASCASRKPAPEPEPATTEAEAPPEVSLALPPAVPVGPEKIRALGRWIPVDWSDLPGLEADAVHEAWNAWLHSCERPVAPFATLCSDVRRLAMADAEEQREWMRGHFQAYRVEEPGGAEIGLLTSYYEPVFSASRVRTEAYRVPLYAPPPGLPARTPWFSRREMETSPAALAALAGSELVWLADPVDAMILHIQGSGRVRVMEPDGREHLVRLAYAATNNQPYSSPASWLLRQGLLRDATWPGIKAWLAQNPGRVQEFLWRNPRVVFFNEEPLPDSALHQGPRGAQGVPLTPGRSIAVDPRSIPYGTPVWLVTAGPTANLRRLVLAQDTGSAIRGAVRADYFAGWGDEAGDLAGSLKQPLRLWVLWPRD